jgi:hypothetical protein
MQLNEFIEGLNILQPYYNKPDGYHIGAEHDIFYMYPTDKQLTETAVIRLCKLGWFQPEVAIADDGEFEAKHYNLHEGWAAFV